MAHEHLVFNFLPPAVLCKMEMQTAFSLVETFESQANPDFFFNTSPEEVIALIVMKKKKMMMRTRLPLTTLQLMNMFGLNMC